MGLIMLPKKTPKKPKHPYDIILASPVIAGNLGPLLFSLPATAIGSSFTGQGRKHVKSVSATITLPGLDYPQQRADQGIVWRCETVFKNTHIHSLLFLFMLRNYENAKEMPSNVFFSFLFFPPDTTSAKTTMAETHLGVDLRLFWKGLRWHWASPVTGVQTRLSQSLKCGLCPVCSQ